MRKTLEPGIKMEPGMKIATAKMLLSALMLGAGAIATGAAAQNLDDILGETDQTTEDDVGFGDGPNELDILSRTNDDEFTDFETQSDRKPIAVTVRALNKVTAKYRDLTIPMQETVTFGQLEIFARYCDKRPPEEFPEATAFLQIFDRGNAGIKLGKTPMLGEAAAQKIGNLESEGEGATTTLAAATENVVEDLASELAANGEDTFSIDLSQFGEKIFSGWMFASSPALNALEHPVYDVWVIDCQTASVDDEISDGD